MIAPFFASRQVLNSIEHCAEMNGLATECKVNLACDLNIHFSILVEGISVDRKGEDGLSNVDVEKREPFLFISFVLGFPFALRDGNGKQHHVSNHFAIIRAGRFQNYPLRSFCSEHCMSLHQFKRHTSGSNHI